MIDHPAVRELRGRHKEVSLSFFYRGGELVSVNEVGGTCNRVSTSTTDLVAAAQEAGADEVLFIHNHPGGSLEPSMEDIITAMQRRDVFEGHDIAVLGNWIVTSEGEVEY